MLLHSKTKIVTLDNGGYGLPQPTNQAELVEAIGSVAAHEWPDKETGFQALASVMALYVLNYIGVQPTAELIRKTGEAVLDTHEAFLQRFFQSADESKEG